MVINVVQAQLIGFDFGSSFMKATLVQPGIPFSIVENTASKRKTETMVTIGDDNRLFGADSYIEHSKYPMTTFAGIQRNFGQKFEDELVAKLKKERFITNEMVSDDRGLIGWKISRPVQENEESKEEIFYSEEIVAMLFQYIKMLAEK